MSSSDNKELNIIPPKSRRKAYEDMVDTILTPPKNADSAKRKALVKEIKRKQEALKKKKEEMKDPVQRHMRTAPRVNAKTGGLLGNPSRMRNR